MSCPWSPEPTMVDIDNGLSLEVDLWGPPAGVPALFVHGGYGGPVTTAIGRPPWFDQVLRVGDPVRMIRYSRRNAGASSYVLEPFMLSDLAADAVLLLDALGVDDAIVVGSSAGGPIALEVALSRPERVRALALVNTGAAIMSVDPKGIPEPPSAAVLARLAEVVDRTAIVCDVVERGPRAVFDERLSEIREALGEQAQIRAGVLGVEEGSLRALASDVSPEDLFLQWRGSVLNWQATMGHDFHDRLGEIGDLGVPVCVVHGDADDVVPFEYGVHLHESIRGSTLCRIAGGAHEIARDPGGAAALRAWLLEVAAG